MQDTPLEMRGTVTASAPSQAFLMGEHAVLYGSPALALSVDRRSFSSARELDRGHIRIRSHLLGLYEEEGGSIVRDNPELEKLAVGVREILERYGVRSGVELEIRSEVPIGSGMASSASVAAAISKSIDGLFELGMDENELLESVYVFERIIHGKASKTGPACAVMGGVIWVEWTGDLMTAESLGFKDVPLVMACTGKPSPTKEMIERVSSLGSLLPGVRDSVVRAISELVVKGRDAIMTENYELLGMLMNIDQGLLYSLGVSSWEIERIVWKARESGSYGAKLSGAGGGGCVVVLHPQPSSLAEELRSVADMAFPARVAREGARLESKSGDRS